MKIQTTKNQALEFRPIKIIEESTLSSFAGQEQSYRLPYNTSLLLARILLKVQEVYTRFPSIPSSD